MSNYKIKFKNSLISKPLVSVILPTYNSRQYILQAIKSVLIQTYENFELIIIDDGSTDGTYDLILDTFPNDSRIKLIRICNSGVAIALNKGIELSEGKYIARLDADDIAEPGRLYSQVSFMEIHEDIGVLGSAAILINAEGKRIGELYKFKYNYQLKWSLILKNSFIHPSVIIRRSLLIQVGCYNNVPSEDGDLWVRLAKITLFHNLNIPLIRYRIHENQITNKIYNDNNNRNVYQFKLQYWEYFGLPKLSYNVFLALRLSKSLEKKQYKEFLYFIWRSKSTFIDKSVNYLNYHKQRSWFLLQVFFIFLKYVKVSLIFIFGNYFSTYLNPLRLKYRK